MVRQSYTARYTLQPSEAEKNGFLQETYRTFSDMRSNTTKVIYFANLVMAVRCNNLHGNARLLTVLLEVLCPTYVHEAS